MFIQKTKKRRAKWVTVLKGTEIIYDTRNPNHQNQPTENITTQTQRRRIKAIVLKGTGIIYDTNNPEHRDKTTETISKEAQKRRAKQVTVLKDSGIIYDTTNPNHQNQPIENITKHTQRLRANQVTVLKGTGIIYDPNDAGHQGKPTENVPIKTQQRRIKVTVLKGTSIIYDANDPEHREKATETVTKIAQQQRAKVTVLQGTDIIYDANNARHQGKPTENVSIQTQQRRIKVTVLQGTGIIYDANNTKYRDKITEAITKIAQQQRAKVTVLQGTGIIYDANNAGHQGKPIENVSIQTQRRRIKVTVLKGTGIIYDANNPEHREKATEAISKMAQRSRAKRVTALKSMSIIYDANDTKHAQRVRARRVIVLKGTGIIYDPNNTKHQGKPTENINVDTQRQRVKVTVSQGTGIIYDPNNTKHQGKPTENIAKSTQRARARQITVLQGTGIIYDANNTKHQGKPTENITKHAQRVRASRVIVLKGTGIIYDINNTKHQGKPTENITKHAQRVRARRVIVLKGMSIIYDANDPEHRDKVTEPISREAQKRRAKRIIVLKGTGIIYDANNAKHQKKSIENITEHTQRLRANQVTVLKGTGIIYDANNVEHQGKSIENVTEPTQKVRARQIAVLQGTNIIYDTNNAKHQNKPIENIAAHTQRRRAKTTVLKGTGIIYDINNVQHQGKSTEKITRQTQKKRVKQVAVLKGTGIIYNTDNSEHQGKSIENVTIQTQQGRIKAIVLKGTGIIYNANNPEHRDKTTETINRATQKRRAKRVIVLKGTGIIYDTTNPNHQNQPTENITKHTQQLRAKQVTVLKGTSIIYNANSSEHHSKSIENITTRTQRRRIKVTVLKSTGIIYDVNNAEHQNKQTENIAAGTRQKRVKVTVLQSTGIIYNARNSGHQDKLTENVTTRTQQQRVVVTVLKSTGIIYDTKNAGHQGKSTENITANTQRQRQRRRRAKKKKSPSAIKTTAYSLKRKHAAFTVITPTTKRQRTINIKSDDNFATLHHGNHFVIQKNASNQLQIASDVFPENSLEEESYTMKDLGKDIKKFQHYKKKESKKRQKTNVVHTKPKLKKQHALSDGKQQLCYVRPGTSDTYPPEKLPRALGGSLPNIQPTQLDSCNFIFNFNKKGIFFEFTYQNDTHIVEQVSASIASRRKLKKIKLNQKIENTPTNTPQQRRHRAKKKKGSSAMKTAKYSLKRKNSASTTIVPTTKKQRTINIKPSDETKIQALPNSKNHIVRNQTASTSIKLEPNHPIKTEQLGLPALPPLIKVEGIGLVNDLTQKIMIDLIHDPDVIDLTQELIENICPDVAGSGLTPHRQSLGIDLQKLFNQHSIQNWLTQTFQQLREGNKTSRKKTINDDSLIKLDDDGHHHQYKLKVVLKKIPRSNPLLDVMRKKQPSQNSLLEASIHVIMPDKTANIVARLGIPKHLDLSRPNIATITDVHQVPAVFPNFRALAAGIMLLARASGSDILLLQNDARNHMHGKILLFILQAICGVDSLYVKYFGTCVLSACNIELPAFGQPKWVELSQDAEGAAALATLAKKYTLRSYMNIVHISIENFKQIAHKANIDWQHLLNMTLQNALKNIIAKFRQSIEQSKIYLACIELEVLFVFSPFVNDQFNHAGKHHIGNSTPIYLLPMLGIEILHEVLIKKLIQTRGIQQQYQEEFRRICQVYLHAYNPIEAAINLQSSRIFSDKDNAAAFESLYHGNHFVIQTKASNQLQIANGIFPAKPLWHKINGLRKLINKFQRSKAEKVIKSKKTDCLEKLLSTEEASNTMKNPRKSIKEFQHCKKNKSKKRQQTNVEHTKPEVKKRCIFSGNKQHTQHNSITIRPSIPSLFSAFSKPSTLSPCTPPPPKTDPPNMSQATRQFQCRQRKNMFGFNHQSTLNKQTMRIPANFFSHSPAARQPTQPMCTPRPLQTDWFNRLQAMQQKNMLNPNHQPTLNKQIMRIPVVFSDNSPSSSMRQRAQLYVNYNMPWIRNYK